jgi:hypothetical protein
MEDVVALHALPPRDDVRADVPDRVPDVEAQARGVREHVEDVVLRLLGVESGLARVRGAEDAGLLPAALPLGLDRAVGFRALHRRRDTRREVDATAMLTREPAPYILSALRGD